MEDAEIGLERGVFALRWRHFIESQQTENREVPPTNTTMRKQHTSPEDTGESSQTDPPASTRAIIPRFPDTDAKMAPTAPHPVEHEIKKLKQKVMTAYKTHKTKTSDHAREEKQALESARKDGSLIFKPPDKCKELVVMTKETYIDSGGSKGGSHGS